MDKRLYTCCFTGHRSLPPKKEEEIWQQVYICIEPLLKQGVRYFGVGGAQGFDTLVAEKLLELRKKNSHLKIILVLPFRGYRAGWLQDWQIRAAQVERQANKVVYCSQTPSRAAFLMRDRHLVEESGYCIGYCTRTTGGTAYIMRYARNQGLQIWNVGEMPAIAQPQLRK